MSHYCDEACPAGCVGTEVRLQWSHYPHGQYPRDGGLWRLERVFEAHKVERGGPVVESMYIPVIVVKDGK